MLADGKIDMGHARALLALSGAEQIQVANEIVAKDLSVRETERLIARLTDKGEEKKSKDAKKSRARMTGFLKSVWPNRSEPPCMLCMGRRDEEKS